MPLFEKEINFLEIAKAQLANPNTDLLQQHYPALVQEYEALLNQVQKLVKISDNTQHKLVNARETIENQNKIIHNDLKKAEDYIKSLLPKPINNDKCKISSHFIPSAQLGGDTFGYHFLDDDNLAIYLIDASGHGVGSALHSVSVLNTLRFETLQGCNFYNPSAVMKSLNKVFKMAEHNNLYFTLWYGVLNLRTLELTHAESGHPPALIFSQDFSLEECESPNYLIGVLDEYEYEQNTKQLNPNSSIYIFSDGIYEIVQDDGEVIPYEDFLEIMTENINNHQDNELECLYQRVKKLNRNNSLEDDFTIIKIAI